MRRRGVSFVEVLVAIAILGLSLIPIVGMFSSAGRQTRQTSDHSTALTLSTQVGEMLRVASWDNPRQSELMAAHPEYAAATPVPESAWFDPIEDSRAPFGEMTPGEDPRIGPATPVLARQLRSSTVATPRAGGDGQADLLDLKIGWTDFAGRPQEHRLAVGVPRAGTYVEPPIAVAQRAEADALILASLFPGRAGPLEAAVAAAGADLATVRAMGDLAVVTSAFEAARAPHQDAVARLSAEAAGASTGAVAARLALGREHEARAATALAAMVYLSTPLKAFAAPGATVRIGSLALAPGALGLPLARAAVLPATFAYHLNSARIDYAKALNETGPRELAPRVRVRAWCKYVELTRLAVLADAGADLPALRACLEAFGAYQRGRNPSLAAYARLELDHASDVAALASAYPTPARTTGLTDFRAALGPATATLRGALP